MRNTFDEAKERATKTRKPPKKNYFNVKITLHDTVYNINVLLVPVAIVVDYYEYYKNKWYHSLTWNEKKQLNCLTAHFPKQQNTMKMKILIGTVQHGGVVTSQIKHLLV